MLGDQEQKQEENAAKEVQFQFKKKQSERAISAIQNSYAYKKQQINAEHWRELKVYDKDVRVDLAVRMPFGLFTLRTVPLFVVQSAVAETEFENLFSEREDDVISTMSAAEYLKALRYRSAAQTPATTKL
jgi:DNA-directed RNA polymerase III subunit RPC5